MKKIGQDFAVSFYNIQTFYSRMEDTLYSSRMIYEVIRNSGIGVGIGYPTGILAHQYCSYDVLRLCISLVMTFARQLTTKRTHQMMVENYGIYWDRQIRYNTAAARIQRQWRWELKNTAATRIQEVASRWLWNPDGPMLKHVQGHWNHMIECHY